ncbi:gas vesicle protein [Bacillus pakistanensis]|uniref:Gas vesicle protein n=1 Tax=Rossellomorea pakistanensis TaxID=992288 RepID=A0ABS2NBP8_9BACI|nr:YtxH domain-containing protein [Bacillus pakistanensis]MBM7585011.1 gas vesicle protein [Bacillus pakistanensis]
MAQQTENKQNTTESNINTKDFLIGTLIGGIVGATTALFLAPKSGKELRTDLNEQAGVWKEKTGQWKDNAVEKSNEFAAVAKEKTSALTKSVQEQSSNIANKVKSYRGQSCDESVNEELPQDAIASDLVREDEANQKLEETKKAFDETEQTIKQ